MGHTPGPWRWMPPGSAGCSAFDTQRLVAPKTDIWVAGAIRDDSGNDAFIAIDNPADGPLIEAAPDLLDACEELLGYVEGEYGLDDGEDIAPWDADDKGPTGAVCRGRAAIAKAKGGG